MTYGDVESALIFHHQLQAIKLDLEAEKLVEQLYGGRELTIDERIVLDQKLADLASKSELHTEAAIELEIAEKNRRKRAREY